MHGVELNELETLLLAPDEWLENQRLNTQTKITILSEELQDILKAIRVKRNLQQKNLVAMRCFGHNNKQAIEVLSLTDAIARLNVDRLNHTMPKNNADEQLRIWYNDGYDIKRASRLKKRKLI